MADRRGREEFARAGRAIGADDRQPASHCLADHHRKPFPPGSEDKQACLSLEAKWIVVKTEEQDVRFAARFLRHFKPE